MPTLSLYMNDTIKPPAPSASGQRFLLLAADASLFTPPVVLLFAAALGVGSHDSFLDRGSVPDYTKTRL